MQLFLIRHGQTPDNVRGSLGTAIPGPPLTDLGRMQAAALVAALDGEPVDSTWASILIRTQETAAPLAAARGTETRVIEGLREIEAGDLEGRTDRESQLRYLETVGAWFDGDLDRHLPGAETGAAFLARYDAAIESIAEVTDGTAVVVSHGAAIRAWAAIRVMGGEAAFLARQPLPNTGTVAIEGEPGAWRLRAWRPATPIETGGTRSSDPTGAPIEH